MNKLLPVAGLVCLILHAGCDTNDPDPLTAVELLTPQHESELDSTALSFTWGAVRGATAYYVEVSSDSVFVGNLNTAFTGETTAGGLHLSPGTYYWRVTAFSPQNGDGPPSLIWRFRVRRPATT